MKIRKIFVFISFNNDKLFLFYFSNGKLSDCPPDRVFSKCVSNCPKTCQNPYINSDNKECLHNCRSGCVCPKGTLLDEGRNRECVPQDECTCLHRGKVFMPDETLLRDGMKWFE